MLGSLLKGYAYAQNPKLTFTTLHPVQALQLRKMQYDLEHAYAPRVTAIAAAAVALPLGVWLGRQWERAVARRREPAVRARTPAIRRRVAERPLVAR